VFIGGLPNREGIGYAYCETEEGITMLDAPVLKSKLAAIARKRESTSCATRKRMKKILSVVKLSGEWHLPKSRTCCRALST